MRCRGGSTSPKVRAIAEEIDAYEPTKLRDVPFLAHSDEGYEAVRSAVGDVT